MSPQCAIDFFKELNCYVFFRLVLKSLQYDKCAKAPSLFYLYNMQFLYLYLRTNIGIIARKLKSYQFTGVGDQGSAAISQLASPCQKP